MGQNEIVLVDTSSWVEALRTSGKSDIRERIEKLLSIIHLETTRASFTHRFY